MSLSTRWGALLTVLLLTFARADSALAQSGTIAGRVTSTTPEPTGTFGGEREIPMPEIPTATA